MSNNEIDTYEYSIGAVARMTGLTTHTIRKWEERYRLIEPKRTEGDERMFNPAHVHRLARLKSLGDAGMDIGMLTRMSDHALERATDELLPVIRDSATAHPRPKGLAVADALPQFVRQHAARLDKLECLVEDSVADVDRIRTRADVVAVECASERVHQPRFSQAKLMRVASVLPAMACECPHHLADLLLAVSAFERYTLDCEDTPPKDARLHGFLGATAASARVLFEDALVEVARAEGISLDEHV